MELDLELDWKMGRLNFSDRDSLPALKLINNLFFSSFSFSFLNFSLFWEEGKGLGSIVKNCHWGLKKVTITMILHILCTLRLIKKHTKVKVRSPDVDTDYFDIVAGVLQGDPLAPYLFIICLEYLLRTSIDIMKDNGCKMVKKINRRYPAQTITDADYADDIALLTNTPAQAETLLHRLERVAAGIGLHVNANKTEYIKEVTFLHKMVVLWN